MHSIFTACLYHEFTDERTKSMQGEKVEGMGMGGEGGEEVKGVEGRDRGVKNRSLLH